MSPALKRPEKGGMLRRGRIGADKRQEQQQEQQERTCSWMLPLLLPLPLLFDCSSDVLALQRRSLRYQIMTRRWIEISDIRRVTVDTRETAILINRNQFLIQILSEAIFVMTLSTRRYRHIGFQPAQR